MAKIKIVKITIYKINVKKDRNRANLCEFLKSRQNHAGWPN